MQPSGVLKVIETITWRFGSNSGRHGIQRDLPRALLLWIPVLPIIITFAVIRAKLKRGQRTPEGRAMCDKYLPWAIIFELADRWAKICGDLVTMGRLPNEKPYWYIGTYQMTAFNTAFLTSKPHLGGDPGRLSVGRGWYRLRRW
jgi:hypothetical protein